MGDDDDYERWCRYYLDTEEFDLAICRFKNNHGEGVPCDADERRACSRYARERMAHYGLTSGCSSPGKLAALGLSIAGLRREVAAFDAYEPFREGDRVDDDTTRSGIRERTSTSC